MACGLNLLLGWEGIQNPRITKNLGGKAHAESVLTLTVKLLPIVGDAEMRELLRRVLEADGWARQSDGTMTRRLGAGVACLSADGETVTLTVEATAEVRATATVEQGEGESDTKAERRALAEAKKNLVQAQARAKEGLQTASAQALLREEPGLREAIQTALNKVYREALEKRARALGEVESVQERGEASGDYEVTVVVRA